MFKRLIKIVYHQKNMHEFKNFCTKINLSLLLFFYKLFEVHIYIYIYTHTLVIYRCLFTILRLKEFWQSTFLLLFLLRNSGLWSKREAVSKSWTNSVTWANRSTFLLISIFNCGKHQDFVSVGLDEMMNVSANHLQCLETLSKKRLNNVHRIL